MQTESNLALANYPKLSQETTYAAILVGGKSSRMGRNKALLQYQGKNLISHLKKTLISIGIKNKNILICGQVPGYKSAIPDIFPSKGPLSGIYTATAKVLDLESKKQGENDPNLLVLPVDMPALDRLSLKSLILNIKSQNACRFEGQQMPVIFKLNSLYLDTLSGFFTPNLNHLEKGPSLKFFLSHLKTKNLKMNSKKGHVFLNLNTPGDYKNFLRCSYESKI